jgi:hypothetical protein
MRAIPGFIGGIASNVAPVLIGEQPANTTKAVTPSRRPHLIAALSTQKLHVTRTGRPATLIQAPPQLLLADYPRIPIPQTRRNQIVRERPIPASSGTLRRVGAGVRPTIPPRKGGAHKNDDLTLAPQAGTARLRTGLHKGAGSPRDGFGSGLSSGLKAYLRFLRAGLTVGSSDSSSAFCRLRASRMTSRQDSSST